MVLHTEPLRALHLCSGYGGFELALRHAGVEYRTVAHVERDAYAAAILVERMEQARLDPAPIWSDLTTFDTAPWAGRVDLVSAGFPCQPFSSAGKQQGVDDDRWLWPAIGRIISDLGCRYVFLENVPGLIRAGLHHVLADLADLGFDAEWGLLPASAVGAPHRRERCWILAVADCPGEGWLRRYADRRIQSVEPKTHGEHVGHAGSSGRSEVARRIQGDETEAERHRDSDLVDGAGEDVADPVREGRQRATGTECPDGHTPGRFPPRPDDTAGWERWSAEGGPQPGLRRGTDGRPAGLADALHLGGNGLVPQCAAEALRQLAERIN